MGRLSRFRTKEGEIVTMVTTKAKAIKLRCLDCANFSYKDVEECDRKNCYLHPYRLGKNPYTGKTRSRAVILYCTSCMNGQPRSIRNCTSKYCSLFAHRIGAKSDKEIKREKRVKRMERNAQ